MVDFSAKKPFIIAGPCSAESRESLLHTCGELSALGSVDVLRAGIWKPRTNPNSFEGVGEVGLEWLAEAKKITGLPICTEVATPKHLELALRAGVDIVWFGARTTVNPFSVQELADALKGVDVGVMLKNPLTPSIELWEGALNRVLRSVDISRIAFVHRGFVQEGSVRYRNNPMWHLAIEMRRLYPDIPMLCDPSHIGGERDYILEIAQKSADLGFNGLMVESHCCPEKAFSDASQQVTPDGLKLLLDAIIWRKQSFDSEEFVQNIECLREEIDRVDEELFSLLGSRMEIADRIGEVKRQSGVTVLQEQRWNDILDRIPQISRRLNLSEEFLRVFLEAVHLESINHQTHIMNKK